MSEYARRSWLYVGAVVGMTAAILYLRSEGCNERGDWNRATTRNNALAYRAYCANWRLGLHAKEAHEKWEQRLKQEYEKLDWLSPYAVREFIDTHPEFRSDEILRTHYQRVLKDGTYECLKRYLDHAKNDDPHKTEVASLIDKMIMKEVTPAVDADDYQALRELAKKYSSWPGCEDRIRACIATARENAARKEWGTISDSRSESELRKFMSKFSGTRASSAAKGRIEALYDDFDFVRTKGSLKAYSDFIKRHPDSPQLKDAWGCVAAELEAYVFRRKSMGGNEALARSLLSEFRQDRPCSGLLYGGGGYCSSPLQINTPTYGRDDYFVKLVNTQTGRSVGIFVRSGTSTEVQVPDGTYSLRYATGTQWHGTKFLFGLNAHYSQADHTFTFSNGSGYTVTLQRVAHGNLNTSSMSAQDF